MIYRTDRKGRQLSVLGFGCMRWQRKGSAIDIEEAEREVLLAVEQGVNYFDTAYVYQGSEAALGEIFARNPGLRDKLYIASKLPHYLIRSREGMDKMFREQLRRLQTDHIDYYLMHMLTDPATWNRLISMGILDWIHEKLSSGEIGSIGFSYHGDSETFQALLDVYDWDFCQIQYNYLDENTQAGRAGLLKAADKGIPVIIMEPLRGGRLVNNLPEEALKMFDSYPVKRSPAAWAFRWLWDQPQVSVVLSGMNTVEMVDENIREASSCEAGSMTDKERELIAGVREVILRNTAVPCTGCGYCMPCPRGVNIPQTFHCRNMIIAESKSRARKEYMQNTAFRQNQTGVSACIECGKCEQHCPQGIAIRRELKEAGRLLETPFYKLAAFLIRKLHIW